MDRAGFSHGVRLFNAAEFYEAHEVWEDVWRPMAASAEKKFLQGLIQIAVGLHHHSTGNKVGALSLLRRGGRNIRECAGDAPEIDVGEFLAQVTAWREALVAGIALPSLPRITKQRDDIFV